MLRVICEDFSFVLVKNRVISEEDREIYIYGLELLFTSLLSAGTMLLLGLVFNKLFITVVFLIVFCSIRSYSGGYHANQYWKCYIVGCLAYMGVIAVVTTTSDYTRVFEGGFFLITSFVGIYLMAPLNSIKNPKTERELKKNKIITRVLISTYTMIATIGICIFPKMSELWFTIACTQLVVTIFLMITILQRRYFK